VPTTLKNFSLDILQASVVECINQSILSSASYEQGIDRPRIIAAHASSYLDYIVEMTIFLNRREDFVLLLSDHIILKFQSISMCVERLQVLWFHSSSSYKFLRTTLSFYYYSIGRCPLYLVLLKTLFWRSSDSEGIQSVKSQYTLIENVVVESIFGSYISHMVS